MNDDRIRKHVKDTFEAQVPDVLAQIKASPDFYVPHKPRVFNLASILKNRIAVSLVSIFVVALLIIGVSRNTVEPVVASTITLDINPSIEITLDEDDYVINVTALNDSGIAVISRDIKYRGLTIDEVLEILVPRLQALGYIVTSIDETNVVLIEVDSTNETIRARVEAAFKTKLDTELARYNTNRWVLNARDIQLTDEQKTALIQDARLQMYTRAKMTLIYRIHDLDDSYQIDELLQLTVKQLYTIFVTLEDPDNLPDYDNMPGRRPNNSMPFGDPEPPRNQ